MHFGIHFEISACVAIGLLFAINSVQAIGDYSATTIGAMDRVPEDRELQNGIMAYGVTNILGALLGGLPTATYSQNVGIVTTTKVINQLGAWAGSRDPWCRRNRTEVFCAADLRFHSVFLVGRRFLYLLRICHDPE